MNIILWIVSFICIVTKNAIVVTAQEVSLGFFTTLAHKLQGEVVLLSERVMEVRGFVYDGTAPAVYFWADTNAVASDQGFRLSDGSPTNGCGVDPIPAEADGTQTYRVEFPDNVSINDILGGSISVWCEEFVTSFGQVSVPTSLTGVPTTANGPDLECSANVETPVAVPTAAPISIPAPTATPIATVTTSSPVVEAETPTSSPTTILLTSAPVDSTSEPTSTDTTNGDAPFLLGTFTTRAHNVTGTVYVISDHILEIQGFTYDGLGPAGYFHIDTSTTPAANGLRLYDGEGGPSPSCGTMPLLAADGTDTYRVEFPNGTSIQDYLGGSFSVWCEVALANFGEVVIPARLPNSISEVDDSALLVCVNENFVSQPYLLGTFTTRAHNVSGTVYVVSDHILEITGFTYDGEGPAGYFHIDTSATPSADGLRLYDSEGGPSPSCGMTKLLTADGTDTYRVEFPNGTSIQDYLGGSFSVWCETASANFGEVAIPATLPESISAVDDSALLVCINENVASQPYLLGTFTTRAHNVSGTVYVVSDHILEITGFTYDGEGPAGYFHIDSSATPSADGLRLYDSAGGNVSSCGMSPLLAADGSDTYRVEFPNGTSIQDYLGGSFSVWCETASANFGEVIIPSALPESVSAVDDSSMIVCTTPDLDVGTGSGVPSFITTPTGFNCEPINDAFQVRWSVEDELLLIELVGIIGVEDYMSFGVSGNTTKTFMIGADVVVADMFEGNYRARDFYMSDRSQCSEGTGVCPDTDKGAIDDVNITSVNGDREQGVTIIRYKRPLVPSDAADIDSPISVIAGEMTYIAWAIGPVSPETGNPQFHTAYPKEDFSIEFGREVVDNCTPLMSDGETATEAPATSFVVPVLQNVTEFVANIGPSGGERGYMSITGQTSWGIAWYINDILAPIIEMRRGTTYKFRVHGGDNVANSAEYHPFYITTSPYGGYQQLNTSTRALETVYAGIKNVVLGDDGSVQNFTSSYAAPICLYETTDTSYNVSLVGTFEEYFKTLDVSCKENTTIMEAGAVFEFTPNASTPDLLYYHCVTHRNLGWKIMVVDAPLQKSADPTTNSTSSAITSYGWNNIFGHLTTVLLLLYICL